MQKVERLAATDPLLACCVCGGMLRDAVQLMCLHNCCRQCFSEAASKGSGHHVTCCSCGSETRSGTEQQNTFVDRLVQHYASIIESRMCTVCEANGDLDKQALVWCPNCRHLLCEDCVSGHRQYYRQHVTESLEEVRSLEEVCLLTSVPSCPIHKKPVEIACLNCEKALCTSCSAECMERKHEVYVIGKESFENYIGKCITNIRAMENELLRKSEVLKKPSSVLADTKAAQERHLHEIKQRKRRIVDAVEMVYQELELSIKNAYDELKGEGTDAEAAANCIASNLFDARKYVGWLLASNDKCEILKQQKVVRERLITLSAKIDILSDKLATTSRTVNVDSLLPEDLNEAIRAWIGVPSVCTAASALAAADPPLQEQQQQQQQSLSFAATSVSIQLPVSCEDVALTKDGQLLLAAAGWHGLIEFSSASGRELSRWRPPKQISGKDDFVLTVAALSAGRVAVSVRYSQHVVLLGRSVKKGGSRSGSSSDGGRAPATSDAAWAEYHHFDQLPWPPCWLSAHGDVLAMTGYLAEERFGCRLLLLGLSSGLQVGSERQREYSIRSLAVAADVVVTVSNSKVKVIGGRRASQVLDAHRLADGDEWLWRHALNSNEQEEEELWGVCADSTGGCLYTAVERSDRSSGRVSALSLADGSQLRSIVLSFCLGSTQSLLLPMRLSLSNDCAAAEHQQNDSVSGRVLLLAALCWDNKTGQCRTVTIHRSNDV